jgi:GH25 family lysozyme M1 (1,4-beta-N-acetylmuramidase)
MARAHGIDVSKWQRYFDASVNPGDIQFIVIRTSYGMMTDERYSKMLESIQPVPLRGAYHYFSSASPWQSQAKLYLNLVRDAGFHFHCLDIESAYNKKSAGFAQAARKWMVHVKEATGQPVVLYTNPNIYNTWLAPYGDWMKEWPLWVAQYFNEPGRNRKPILPRGVDAWALWQYSADTPPNKKGKVYGVGSGNIDLNVYNGTLEELEQWLGLGAPEEIVEEPEVPAEEPVPVEEPAPVGELDYERLAKKLAPLVAPLVAERLGQG